VFDAKVAERFWRKVLFTPDCWLWTGAHHPLGYGRFRVKGSLRLTHRIAYELLSSRIPDGLVIDHLCRIPACVNPLHLEPVTFTENLRRGAGAGKTICKNGHSLIGVRTYLTKRGYLARICDPCAKLHRSRQKAKKVGA
jgi:hypothetical protein